MKTNRIKLWFEFVLSSRSIIRVWSALGKRRSSLLSSITLACLFSEWLGSISGVIAFSRTKFTERNFLNGGIEMHDDYRIFFPNGLLMDNPNRAFEESSGSLASESHESDEWITRSNAHGWIWSFESTKAKQVQGVEPDDLHRTSRKSTTFHL